MAQVLRYNQIHIYLRFFIVGLKLCGELQYTTNCSKAIEKAKTANKQQQRHGRRMVA
jgi:hypothetical protein